MADWSPVDDHTRAMSLTPLDGSFDETIASARATNAAIVPSWKAYALSSLAFAPRNIPDAGVMQTVADRPGDDRRCAIDPTKIETAPWWRPEIVFEDGLAWTVYR